MGCLCLCDQVAGSEFWTFSEFCRRYLEIVFAKELFEEIPGERTEDGWREPPRLVRWTPQGWWRYVESRPLVVIDEVGLRDPTPTAMDTLWEILERRVGRPLILTSNVPPTSGGLGAIYDARIVSRIVEAGTVYEVRGASLRGKV